MIIRIPFSLDGYFRTAIIKRLKRLNPQFDYPNSASWQTVKPTLEETVSREVIELELRNLDLVWQRCLCLTQNGATKIHLVLHPKLYESYKKRNFAFIVSQPIPEIKIYKLPKIERKKVTGRKRKISKQNLTMTTTEIIETKATIKEEIIPEDTDLEKYWMDRQPEAPKQLFTKKHCIDCEQFKVENNMGICPKHNWEIALDLAERDAVCEEL